MNIYKDTLAQLRRHNHITIFAKNCEYPSDNIGGPYLVHMAGTPYPYPAWGDLMISNFLKKLRVGVF